MKNDQTFKFVAAIILAGVIVAFASPNHSAAPAPASAEAPTSHAVPATE